MYTQFISRSRQLCSVVVLSFACSLVSAADAPTATDVDDPWEGYNRAMFSFNSGLDSVLLKPVAKGYKKVVPTPVQKGVNNFFSNLGEVSNLTNNLLQGKADGTATSFFRFVINSTAGWGGIFDIATELGLTEKEEDFGQTLGYWGVASGPYVVLPLFGPSTVRDTGSLIVDYTNYDPVALLDLTSNGELGLTALDVVDLRAGFLAAESLIFGDHYTFIRDVYLQTRERAVRDGEPVKTQHDVNDEEGSWGDDDSWGEDSEEDSWGDDVDAI
ncbi:VacJ family lipoprotein [Marinomonas sp. 2405UD68-3]|uniref:MlaA family lipoprotein n=1 Tax=Marinomonas sp. 2405UD68-3 TaxID=3391835 RepID=UPI0039C9659A